MKCPHCSISDTKVIESREASSGDAIRRRRQCLVCAHRFTTFERAERPHIAVIKKDGARELFDRHKLFAAIHRSVGKFVGSELEIEELVAAVEDNLFEAGEPEVRSAQIGDLVLRELATRNKVAYVRFASVYREFKTIEQYEAALKYLRDEQQ